MTDDVSFIDSSIDYLSNVVMISDRSRVPKAQWNSCPLNSAHAFKCAINGRRHADGRERRARQVRGPRADLVPPSPAKRERRRRRLSGPGDHLAYRFSRPLAPPLLLSRQLQHPGQRQHRVAAGGPLLQRLSGAPSFWYHKYMLYF